MLVLGALSVLGSAQAAAQLPAVPTIEMAEYDSATPRIITVTTDGPVYLDEGTLDALAADFALSGGTLGTGVLQGPLAVDMETTSVPGSTEIELRFASTIASLRGSGTLSLRYTAVDGRTILRSGDTAPANRMVSTTDPHITVTGPDDDTELTLEISTTTKAAFQDPLGVGTSFTAVPLPVATGTADTVTYSIRGLPPGLIIVAGSADVNTPDEVATVSNYLGVEGTTPGQLAMTDGDFIGLLPHNIGNFPVVYTATTGSGATLESAEDGFTIKLATTPEAVTDLQVNAAGPASLTVTWKAGSDNNDKIISYDLQYKAAGTTAWLDALLPRAVVASKTYTIEGLAPGTYDVQVRATNMLGDSIWAMASGSTGAGPGTVTLGVTVEETVPEGRAGIPVTVKAEVPPGYEGTIAVTLTLGAEGTAEERAEVPNDAGIPPDVNWAGSTTAKTTLSFTFNSNLEGEEMVYLNTASDADAEDEKFKISAASAEVPGVFKKAGAKRVRLMIADDEVQEYKLELPIAVVSDPASTMGEFKEGYGDNRCPCR